MTHPIIQEARELYRQTVNDPNYKRSHIWNEASDNHKQLTRIINTCETPEEVISSLENTDMYAIRISDQRTFDLMMEWHRDVFLGPDGDDTLFPVPDIITTPNLYKMLFYVQEIAFSSRFPETVVELGGGNGQFARVLRQWGAQYNCPIQTHIDIDIPESLYMAYVCTRHWHPDDVCVWLPNNDISIITPFVDKVLMDHYQPSFVFVPVGYENLISFTDLKIDLFVNTASMGELPNETIRYWMDFVQNKINVKYFFGLNRYLNTIHGYDCHHGYCDARKNENEASVLFDDRWQVLKWELEPEFCRCPYEDPKIARYLEVILKRSDKQTIPHSYLDNVRLEDWWRYREVDAFGTHRSNQMVHDLTQDGTLFKLWNALRLRPNSETYQMMLAYMKHIGRPDMVFEEEFYYKRLFDS